MGLAYATVHTGLPHPEKVQGWWGTAACRAAPSEERAKIANFVVPTCRTILGRFEWDAAGPAGQGAPLREKVELVGHGTQSRV